MRCIIAHCFVIERPIRQSVNVEWMPTLQPPLCKWDFGRACRRPRLMDALSWSAARVSIVTIHKAPPDGDTRQHVAAFDDNPSTPTAVLDTPASNTHSLRHNTVTLCRRRQLLMLGLQGGRCLRSSDSFRASSSFSLSLSLIPASPVIDDLSANLVSCLPSHRRRLASCADQANHCFLRRLGHNGSGLSR